MAKSALDHATGSSCGSRARPAHGMLRHLSPGQGRRVEGSAHHDLRSGGGGGGDRHCVLQCGAHGPPPRAPRRRRPRTDTPHEVARRTLSSEPHHFPDCRSIRPAGAEVDCSPVADGNIWRPLVGGCWIHEAKQPRSRATLVTSASRWIRCSAVTGESPKVHTRVAPVQRAQSSLHPRPSGCCNSHTQCLVGMLVPARFASFLGVSPRRSAAWSAVSCFQRVTILTNT